MIILSCYLEIPGSLQLVVYVAYFLNCIYELSLLLLSFLSVYRKQSTDTSEGLLLVIFHVMFLLLLANIS